MNRWLLLFVLCCPGPVAADPPRCRVVPEAGHQAVFRLAGEERVRWHFGPEYPRPFFYPLRNSAGTVLTRLGHPGAPDHDHHRSIWFAHHDVAGVNFWSDRTGTRVRQKQWLVYRDGPAEAVMAVLLGWFDGEGRELMEQELVASWRPGRDGAGPELELQSRFVPKDESLVLGKTNFGFLGVRMAKELSEHFGEGRLVDSEGRTGEGEIFGQRARWVAYTGKTTGEGVVYFDHPANPRHPTHWHVREDGWMAASFGMKEAFTLTRGDPLVLRYLLLASDQGAGPPQYEEVAGSFAKRPELVVRKSARRHRHFEVERAGE